MKHSYIVFESVMYRHIVEADSKKEAIQQIEEHGGDGKLVGGSDYHAEKLS